MAKLIDAGGEPVNNGEIAVLEALASQLADDARIIPNWTVVHPNRLDECDAIVVTRDAVFIIETKQLAGTVEIYENDFWVDGTKRRNPYHLTHQKAQRLRTKLNNALPWFEQKGRVEAQVILAIAPRELEIDPLMVGRFIGIPAIAKTLNSPSERVHPQQVGKLAGRADEIVEAILGGGRQRERDKYSVHDYRIDEVIYEDPAAGYFQAIATNLLTSTQQMLEVSSPLVGLPAQQLTEWRMGMVAPVRAAQKIGAHGSLLSPTGVTDRDDGSIVIMWPMLGETAIKVGLDNGTEFDTDEAKGIVRDIASALAHIHAAGFSHGAVDPINCASRPGPRGVLRFGSKVAQNPAGQQGDLVSLGHLAGVLAERAGASELAGLAAELIAPGASGLTAAEVVARLSEGVVVVVEGGASSINDLFSDLEPLTSDGVVTVFAGTDAGGARVAIKVLGDADSTDPETWREYRSLRDLTHPSIVRTLGVGTATEGPYMITELLGGTTVAKLDDQGQRLSDSEKLSLAAQLLSALSSIHPDAVRIAELMSTSDPENEARADELRNAGVVHNDVCPENIRWISGRGAVLFDFDMAGRVDSYMGQLSKPYRPADLPADIAAPDADIYAVGAILHELLTGLLPYEIDEFDRRIVQIDEKIDPALRGVLEIACAAELSDRFRTADEFLDALLAAGVEVIDLGSGDDKLDRIRVIDDLIRDGQFDAALEMCDESWVRLRESIEKKREALTGGDTPLLVVDGVELRYRGPCSVGPVQSAKQVSYETADGEKYGAVFPDGSVLEFGVLWGQNDGKLDLWVTGLDEIHTHPNIGQLIRRLRPGSEFLSEDPLRIALRLYLAIPGEGDHASVRKSVTVEELNVAAGFNVEGALLRAGAIALDTFERLNGDTSRNRANLGVVFDPFAPGGSDIAAIAYFASRVMALFRTI